MNWEYAFAIFSAALAALAAVSSVVAVLAWRDAKRSANSFERSAKASEVVAGLERDRRHDELTPELAVTAKQWGRTSSGRAAPGPPGLDRLDGIALRVRDDRTRTLSSPAT